LQRRVASRDTSLTSKPSLHRGFGQSWCPLGLRANSPPHSAHTTDSHGTIVSSSSSTNSSFKKRNPPHERRVRDLLPSAARQVPLPSGRPRLSPQSRPSGAVRSLAVLALRLDQLDRPSLLISRQGFGICRRPSGPGDQCVVTFY